MDESKNTNVYISGLPTDITDDEFKELMSKYGLIMFDPIKKGPKLKLYRDENGEPKGDGRCCYIKVLVTCTVLSVHSILFYNALHRRRNMHIAMHISIVMSFLQALCNGKL